MGSRSGLCRRGHPAPGRGGSERGPVRAVASRTVRPVRRRHPGLRGVVRLVPARPLRPRQPAPRRQRGRFVLLLPVGGRRPALRSDFDGYLLDDTLVYAKEPCVPEDVDATFFLHVDPIDPDDLPGPRRRYGFDNLDFRFDDRGSLIGGVCAVEVPLPEYGVAAIRTGQYMIVERGFHHLWEGEIHFGSGPGRRRPARWYSPRRWSKA